MNTDKDLATLTEFAPPPTKEKSIFERWLSPFMKREDSIDNIAPPAPLQQAQPPPSPHTVGGRPPPMDPRSVTNSPTLLAKIRTSLSLKDIEGPEAKKYWMPDDDAAVCYECQQPFSIFVRRHHCRICGLLFCWKCSDHSIEDYQGVESPIRVCNYCYALLHTPGFPIEASDIAIRRDSTSEEAVVPTTPTEPPTTGLSKLISSASFLKGSSPFAKKEVSPVEEEPPPPDPVPMQYDDEDDDEDEEELGMYDDDDDSDEEPTESSNRSITPKVDSAQNGTQVPSNTSSFDSFKLLDRRAPSPIPEGLMSPRRKSDVDGTMNDDPMSPRVRNISPSSLPPTAFVHLAEASLQPLAQHPRVTNRDKSWAQFPLGTLGLSTGASEPQVQAKAHQIIEQSADRHLVRLVSQLLAHGELRSSWAPIILKLAREVCKRIQLNVKGGDKMNVRHYVKVKKIPGGTMQECQYVDGVVITKNVTHKKMRANIPNPRILLLSCPLEYQRGENRLLFFDYLITQEKTYLKLLVSKIAALKPDLVMVEKTVSRHAQDFLLEENISLASNVKPHVMERLSRQLRGELLPTLDILLPMANTTTTTTTSSASASGSSSSFSTLPTAPPVLPQAPPPAKLVNSATGEEAAGTCGDFHMQRYNGDWGAKTLMHFDNCPKELGCTLTIRGGTTEELARVKTILLFSIYAAYSLHLEGHVLLNEHATYHVINDKSDQKTYDLTPAFSCSSQVEFVEPPLPSRLLQPHINTYTYTPTRYASLHPRGKAFLMASLIAPHTHAFFGENAEHPSLLQLQCTLEDDAPTACSCNHPFSLERAPNADFSFVTPSTSPQIQNPLSASLPLTLSLPPAPMIAPIPVYPGRPAISPANANHAHAHPPHAHGHSDAHVDAHAHDAEPHTAYSMQTLVYVHSLLCSSTSTQCIPHELHAIDYYSENDITVGEFLEQMCFDTGRVCLVKECNRGIIQHERAFIHGNGRLNITIENIQKPVAQTGDKKEIMVYSYCKICKTATALTPMSPEMWNYSFGKYLELSFYCTNAINQAPECAHSVFRDHIRYFTYGTLVAQIAYEPIQRLHVVLPPIRLEHDPNVKVVLRQKELGLLTTCSDQVYDAILAKLLQLQTITEEGGPELALQISTFVQSLQKEKAIFMSKLAAVREQDVDPNELRDLTRTLYANFMTWNSMLNEVVNNANNPDPYKYKQNRKLNASTSSTSSALSDVSPRVSRGISKQDLASIAEHAPDLAHNPNLHGPTLHGPTSHLSSNAGSQPGSGNTSFTNYNNVSISQSLPTNITTPASIVASRGGMIRMSDTGIQFPVVSPTPPHPVPAANATSTNNSSTSSSSTNNSPKTETFLAAAPSEIPPTPELPNPDATKHTVQFAPDTVEPGSPEVQIEVTPPFAQADLISNPASPSVGSDPLAQSPSTIKPSPAINPSPSINPSPAIIPNPSPAINKPSKLMTTISSFVSAISSSRILDPTIPYLFLPQGEHNDISVAIYENEPSTVIAYTLSSAEFKEKFDLHYNEFQPPTPVPSLPPISASASLPSSAPATSRARSRSQSLSRPPPTSRGVSPEPPVNRSRSSSLANALSHAVAASASVSIDAAVIAEEPGVESPGLTHALNSLNSLPVPNDMNKISSHSSSNSDSETSSANESANSFSNLQNAHGTNLEVPTGSNRGSRTPSPTPNGANEPANGKGHSSTPTPGNEDKSDDGFTDRNVTLAKYLLCGDHREIRNKYVHDKGGSSVTIYCTTYYPLQFNAMRELMAGGEERFIESLSRCKTWNAKGGKSGSLWAKTLDDRYVIKQVSRIEITGFLEFAPQYFEYLCKAFFHKVPTLMSKIFGVFSIKWKDGVKKDLIVMENLHYNCTLTQVYDLKGSLRGRMVENPTADDVQLDENLLRTNYTSPICITEYSKTILGQAVWNDTAFLASHNVMDYSMLAGIGKNGELVVGIIDYIRRFTLDKKVENLVKVTVGRGRAPTVISPKQYKTRFRDAMWMYFVMAPNKFTRVIHPPPPSTQDKEKERLR